MYIMFIAGLLLFLFILWKKLKDDYLIDVIFSSGFITLFGGLIGYATSFFYFKDATFWLVVLGFAIGFGLSLYKFKLKFFEFYEALSLASLSWLAIKTLSDTALLNSLNKFIEFWIATFSIFIFLYVNNYYKTFTWYKSGRVGIAGVLSLIVFFGLRFGFLKDYISLAVVFVNFLLLLNLLKSKQ